MNNEQLNIGGHEKSSAKNDNENPIIVGLDIGTTKIACIAGRKNEYGKLEIVGFWPRQQQWCKTWPGIEY